VLEDICQKSNMILAGQESYDQDGRFPKQTPSSLNTLCLPNRI
jgi:hypothetical protein